MSTCDGSLCQCAAGYVGTDGNNPTQQPCTAADSGGGYVMVPYGLQADAGGAYPQISVLSSSACAKCLANTGSHCGALDGGTCQCDSEMGENYRSDGQMPAVYRALYAGGAGSPWRGAGCYNETPAGPGGGMVTAILQSNDCYNTDGGAAGGRAEWNAAAPPIDNVSGSYYDLACYTEFGADPVTGSPATYYQPCTNAGTSYCSMSYGDDSTLQCRVPWPVPANSTSWGGLGGDDGPPNNAGAPPMQCSTANRAAGFGRGGADANNTPGAGHQYAIWDHNDPSGFSGSYNRVNDVYKPSGQYVAGWGMYAAPATTWPVGGPTGPQ
jgi:hypothetical protein